MRASASGVNNAVASVAGLLAIAVFGVALARTFDARVRPRLDRLGLSSGAREGIDRELRKVAGADLTQVSRFRRGNSAPSARSSTKGSSSRSGG